MIWRYFSHSFFPHTVDRWNVFDDWRFTNSSINKTKKLEKHEKGEDIMLFDGFRRTRYYRLLDGFCRLSDTDKLVKAYPGVFRAICKFNFHLRNRTIQDMFDALCRGNWEHLWETEREKKQTREEILACMRDDIKYCSDRMTWDRLLRIHWRWQRFRYREKYGES